MSTEACEEPSLFDGQRLSRDEFMRRYEAMPHLKKAELIGGVVRMPSPVSRDHGTGGSRLRAWLGVYAAFTPGCEGASNSTWLMRDDAPQPDADLRILPKCGGASRPAGPYVSGAPELITEVNDQSSRLELEDKKKLYRSAGVFEYLVLLLAKRELRWQRLLRRSYRFVSPSADGLIRSTVFPGLWLDVSALLAGEMAQVLRVLYRGLESPEHAAFVNELAHRHR